MTPADLRLNVPKGKEKAEGKSMFIFGRGVNQVRVGQPEQNP